MDIAASGTHFTDRPQAALPTSAAYRLELPAAHLYSPYTAPPSIPTWLASTPQPLILICNILAICCRLMLMLRYANVPNCHRARAKVTMHKDICLLEPTPAISRYLDYLPVS